MTSNIVLGLMETFCIKHITPLADHIHLDGYAVLVRAGIMMVTRLRLIQMKKLLEQHFLIFLIKCAYDTEEVPI